MKDYKHLHYKQEEPSLWECIRDGLVFGGFLSVGFVLFLLIAVDK